MAASPTSRPSIPTTLPSLEVEDYEQLATIRSGLESELETAKTGCCFNKKLIKYLSYAIRAIDVQIQESFKKTITERNDTIERNDQLERKLALSETRANRATEIASSTFELAASRAEALEQSRQQVENLTGLVKDTKETLSSVKQRAQNMSRGGGWGMGLGIAGAAIVCGWISIPAGLIVAGSGALGAAIKSRKQ